MPFDGIGFAFDDRVSKLDRVIDMLSTPDKWCKGAVKTPDGRYCLRGAIRAVQGIALVPVVLRAIDEVTGKCYFRVEAFNDHLQTDHTLVLQVLARARENLVMGASSRAPVRLGWWGRLRARIVGFG